MTLSIPKRLALLHASVFLSLGGALLLFGNMLSRQEHQFFDERVLATERIVGKLVELKEKSLQVHVLDYSRWDELVEFTSSHSAKWAEFNIEESLPEFGVDAAWVLTPEGRTIYSISSLKSSLLPNPPGNLGLLRQKLRAQPYLHYFAAIDSGVIEIRSAPIQPTHDIERTTPARGYYVVGRAWSRKLLSEIALAADGRLDLVVGAQESSAPPSDVHGIIEIQDVLHGLDGSASAVLHFQTMYPVIAQVEQATRQALLLLAVFSLGSLLLSSALLNSWVIRPLNGIARSLRCEDPGSLKVLAASRNEFGRMASLIVEFFAQKAWLEKEIEERRRAEIEIVVQKDFIRQVIDTDPNPIHVTDLQGNFILVNRAASTLFNTPIEVLLRGSIKDVVHDRETLEWYEHSAQNEPVVGTSFETEQTITTRAGDRHRYQVIRCLFRNPEGRIQVLSIKVDITEREKTHQKLLEAKQAAEAAGRAKSDFLANVSHEIRTPMHGILSYARFGLKESATASREDLLDFFTNINDCGVGLLELLNNLLDFSKLEAGRMQFEMEDVDLAEIVGGAMEEFGALARERSVELRILAEEEPLILRMDRMKVRQVLRNLISNSLKFSRAGGSITVSKERLADRVRVLVDDEGVGIPSEDLKLVFDKFSQSSTTRSSEGGTGLGLAICREIIQAHAGRIWAENRHDGGTRIVFELPARCGQLIC